jgi:hypothetical protein
MAGRKYPQVEPGQWLTPIRKGYGIQCCDCGLVHKFDFRVRGGRIELRAWRDNRATGQVRRHRGITVTH